MLLPGQAASFANYTSYSRGINGIMIDVAGSAGTLSAGDFAFRVGNPGDPGTWSPAPAPISNTIRPGAGVNGSDRVTLTWADNAIQDQWLQVTVNADADTALTQPDVFYFGNAIGESGNSAGDAAVTAADVLAARGRISAAAAPIDSRWDYDRDGLITAADVQIARQNLTAGDAVLQLITAPALPLAVQIAAADTVLADTVAAAPASAATTSTNTSGAIPDTASPAQAPTPPAAASTPGNPPPGPEIAAVAPPQVSPVDSAGAPGGMETTVPVASGSEGLPVAPATTPALSVRFGHRTGAPANCGVAHQPGREPRRDCDHRRPCGRCSRRDLHGVGIRQGVGRCRTARILYSAPQASGSSGAEEADAAA